MITIQNTKILLMFAEYYPEYENTVQNKPQIFRSTFIEGEFYVTLIKHA
ncbi:hypothetical protein J22TS1_49330 [Siminovitchia terrae]|nr:hypothetical protein J22TS1_49330 [Siminovitchia terrae]